MAQGVDSSDDWDDVDVPMEDTRPAGSSLPNSTTVDGSRPHPIWTEYMRESADVAAANFADVLQNSTIYQNTQDQQPDSSDEFDMADAPNTASTPQPSSFAAEGTIRSAEQQSRAPVEQRPLASAADPNSAATRAGCFPGESVDDMVLRMGNELGQIVEKDWDTMIFIGPPPKEQSQSDIEYEYIQQHFAKPYLMRSETLRAVNSKRFNELLGPKSARAERRLKKLGIHHQQQPFKAAKYYIDLRPMQDEEEALLMITELTCTSGILSWHKHSLASGVPKTLICGRDSLHVSAVQRPPTPDLDDIMNDPEGTLTEQKPTKVSLPEAATEPEEEYSSLRHHMGIERLLHAIAGSDPKLNSAPKVWTFFALAKYFDCAHNTKVNSWAYSWLISGNNSNFIQANPEVCYRMAMGMHHSDILRAAFAILVGEKALMQSNADAPASLTAQAKSVHGRKLCHLDDDELNRIDHAAQSLAVRVRPMFDILANGAMSWMLNSPECKRLRAVQDEWPREQSRKAYQVVKDYVRGEIFNMLAQETRNAETIRRYNVVGGHKSFGLVTRPELVSRAYASLALPQRLLTQSYWSRLESGGLYQDHTCFINMENGFSLRGISKLAPELNEQEPIQCVSKQILFNTITAMNNAMAFERGPAGAQAMPTSSRMAPTASTSTDPNHSEDDPWGEPSVADGRDPSRGWPASARMLGDTASDDDRELAKAIHVFSNANLTTNYAKQTQPEYRNLAEPDYRDFECRNVCNEHLRKANERPDYIDVPILIAELSLELRKIVQRKLLTPGYVADEIGIETEIPVSDVDTLLCLNDDEWKYLPLWAGGLDDETGGVFNELDVPDLQGGESSGFRGGKIGLSSRGGVDGAMTDAGSMAGDSEFSDIATDEGVSTVGKASRFATDGTRTDGSTVMSFDGDDDEFSHGPLTTGR